MGEVAQSRDSDPIKHILLVDDDTVFLKVMNRAIGRRGLRVSYACSARKALVIVKTDPPDYAVIDLKMEETSGLILLPKLLEEKRDMRILILTGYSSITTAVESIKRGACNYLCKPATIDDILAALLLPYTLPDDSLIPSHPISVNRLQWEHIQRVLNENNGNISATARALGMHRRTLQRRLQKRPVQH